MKAQGIQTVAALMLGAIPLFAYRPALLAGERVEYEGELRFSSPSSSVEPPPLIRVVTENGKVQQISFRDRNGRPDRTEVFDFEGTKVIRYRIVSTASGRQTASYDPTRDTTLSQPERTRITRLAEMLLRHFHQKGSYRRVPTSGPRGIKASPDAPHDHGLPRL